MANRWGNNGNSDRLCLGRLQNHCRWWLQPWKTLAPWKTRTNLDSILKSRDITLLTKVHLVRAMIFLVVMYGCESWTIKKAEHPRMDIRGGWLCGDLSFHLLTFTLRCTSHRVGTPSVRYEHKMLMKERHEYTMFMDQKTVISRRWILPQITYGFCTVSTRIPAEFFVDVDKLILKFMWKGKGSRIAKPVFEKKKVRGFTVPDLKLTL